MIYHNISKNSTYGRHNIYIFPSPRNNPLLLSLSSCWTRDMHIVKQIYFSYLQSKSRQERNILLLFSRACQTCTYADAFKQCTKMYNYLLLSWSYKTAVELKLFFAHFCSYENESTLLLVASFLPLSCQFIHQCGHCKSANPHSQSYSYLYWYLSYIAFCICGFA